MEECVLMRTSRVDNPWNLKDWMHLILYDMVPQDQ